MVHGLHAQLVMPKATGAMLAPLLARRAGEDLLNGVLPCYNLYATQDGRHRRGRAGVQVLKVACEVFERPDWVQRHWQRGQLPGSPDCAALRAEVAQLVASQPLAVWSERFARRDACVTRCSRWTRRRRTRCLQTALGPSLGLKSRKWLARLLHSAHDQLPQPAAPPARPGA
jgi:crotonobetainyl-CoA:carnitine CoA-transferase CaiB-like acyl-CoA transferase